MRTLRRLRPSAACLYFVAVIGGTVFVGSPVLRAVSLCFAVLSVICCGEVGDIFRESGFYLITAAAVTFLNPVIVTYGATPLFMIGKRPYTLEALMYGGCNAMALVAVMLWFRLFTRVMTSDRIGAMMRRPMLSSAASVFTLTLRYVPELKRRYSAIRLAQKTAGYTAGDTYITRLRVAAAAFFSLTASSLELSARSADSMKARGYELRPHSYIGERPISVWDILMIAAAAGTAVMEWMCKRRGSLYSVFYPTFSQRCPVWCACIFAAICALPVIFSAREELKWRSSEQKI